MDRLLKINKEQIKIKETGDSRYIYQTELGNITDGDFKDFNKKTVADKVLCDKAFNFGKNAK